MVEIQDAASKNVLNPHDPLETVPSSLQFDGRESQIGRIDGRKGGHKTARFGVGCVQRAPPGHDSGHSRDLVSSAPAANLFHSKEVERRSRCELGNVPFDPVDSLATLATKEQCGVCVCVLCGVWVCV